MSRHSSPERGAEALRFADALFWFWYGMSYRLESGQFREARQYIEAALERAAGVDPLLHGRALLAAGLTALAQGDNECPRDTLTECLALVRDCGDDLLRTCVLAKLGASHLMLGDGLRAAELLDEAYALRHRLPQHMIQAFVYYWRGIAAMAAGDVALAREIFEQNAALGRRMSHRTIYAHSSGQLGNSCCSTATMRMASCTSATPRACTSTSATPGGSAAISMEWQASRWHEAA